MGDKENPNPDKEKSNQQEKPTQPIASLKGAPTNNLQNENTTSHQESGNEPHAPISPPRFPIGRRIWFAIWGEEPKRTDQIIAGATVVIAITTILQWIAISHQLGEMKAAGKQTDQLLCLYTKQIEKLEAQVEATTKLANAQARIARPYVGIFASNVRQDMAAKQIPFEIVLKNFGSTPGTHFLAAYLVKVGGQILKPDAKYKQGPGTIFPGQDESIPGSIGQGDFDDVVSGKKNLDIEIVAIYKGPDEEQYQYCVKQNYATAFNAFYVTATEDCTLVPK